MLRDVLHSPHSSQCSHTALLPVWCWWWRNKEGAAAAAVVVVLESCHQQRGQHHQQQRPEPAPRCSRSCGISSSTDVGSLPFPPLPSRAGQGVRGDLARKLRYKRCYRHSPQYSSAPAHLWCEGVVWAGVGGECLRLCDASISQESPLSVCLALCSLLATDNIRVGTLATLQLCRASVASVECSVATPGSVLFILPTNTVTASHQSAVRAVQTLATYFHPSWKLQTSSGENVHKE